jgi:Nucleotidyl transferase AbiEii toxin, Type IV TA system
MQADTFKDFRLVGGTALSLYRGHRLSEDIDLFTDAPYGSIDFGVLTDFMTTR